MFRRGDVYTLTYDDSNLPRHYGWKIVSRLDDIERRYCELQYNTTVQQPEVLESQIRQIIADLDEKGRWVSIYRGERLVGQPKFKPNESYISSAVFSRNIERLSEYITAMQNK